MSLQGNDLIISAGGLALAAAKSCTVDLKADTIETSSPLDGQYRHYIAGRKQWTVQTSHLILAPDIADGTIRAVGMSTPKTGKAVASVTVDKTTHEATAGAEDAVDAARDDHATADGLCVVLLAKAAPYKPDFRTLETDWGEAKAATPAASAAKEMVYDGSYFTAFHLGDGSAYETEAASMASFLTANATNFLIAIVSVGPFRLTSALVTAIKSSCNVDLSALPVDTEITQALSVIGGSAWNNGQWTLSAGEHAGEKAVTTLSLADGAPNASTAVADMLVRVGKTYTLDVSVAGYPDDTLSGTAICTQCRVTATRGSLAQGSFTWQGTGPLE